MCPALPGTPRLAELFAAPRDVAALGFALAQLPREAGRSGPVLWVQDRMAALETGRPCGQSCAGFGLPPGQLLLACARTAAEVLWTMEEGLRCASLSAIIGEVWGDPRALGFTATKRLAMRAERQGVHVFLVRFGGAAHLSAARERWRVRSLPSSPHPYDPKAPGSPRWQAELFKGRGMRPGMWEAGYDRAAHRLHLVPALRNGAMAVAAGPASPAGLAVSR
ncbi:recA-like protein [Pacificimonas sp. WHA3]|uniref:RecA-like protein n=1 Tax=Pacificimonas pallii TaxID=2827236 RepID=A0ABS6SBQ2_9SPHN|nr:recA-like protein [Pacificimonas pallii]MBV7255845.1 recA-like protein [Pacificimonas pallii]